MGAKRSLPALTALKGLFIFLIVFAHTLPDSALFDAMPGTSFIRLYGGGMGNIVFFTLSGFLFSYSYRERICAGAISFKAFLLRRLEKLYPLYLLTNAAALIPAVMHSGISAINLKKIVFTILLQMGGGLESEFPYNGPTWFVSALFACYVVFFFIAFYAKKPIQYHIAIVVGIIWGYMLKSINLTIPYCSHLNALAFMCFFIGCALAELYPLINQQMNKWLRPVSFFVLVLSFFLMFRYGVEIISGGFNEACAFLLCPLILYLALADGWCSKLLLLKPLVLLGKISVSVYFWHWVLYLMMSLLMPVREMTGGEYALYLLVLIAWSAVSYRFLEKGKMNSVAVLTK